MLTTLSLTKLICRYLADRRLSALLYFVLFCRDVGQLLFELLLWMQHSWRHTLKLNKAYFPQVCWNYRILSALMTSNCGHVFNPKEFKTLVSLLFSAFNKILNTWHNFYVWWCIWRAEVKRPCLYEMITYRILGHFSAPRAYYKIILVLK